MSGIKVDPGWLTGYATTAEQVGDDLASALATLHGSPLPATAFGDIGRQLGTPGAYQGAATLLLQQLSRAADDLRSAATNLRTVASGHSSVDENQAAALRRVR